MKYFLCCFSFLLLFAACSKKDKSPVSANVPSTFKDVVFYGIAGTVECNGRPLSGIVVTAESTIKTTDSLGRFSFHNLRKNSVSLKLNDLLYNAVDTVIDLRFTPNVFLHLVTKEDMVINRRYHAGGLKITGNKSLSRNCIRDLFAPAFLLTKGCLPGTNAFV